MNSPETIEEVSKEKLMQDLRLVVSDADELLRATAGQAGEKLNEARERIKLNLVTVKENLAIAQERITIKAKQAAKATDEYVQDNPWKSVGIAAGAGLLIGMLISRGR